ncbi:MAG TPA: L-serine ammonia-lyase, iron-sulfur-dependent, subunit alpha [Phycisphaerales bacterium]|nr:L-serine ammonia-lyase, iron-sulfur-dependent, subunit alpha [Phycisphaerales bacterium]
MEPISVFDIFKVGVGPSSSHTLGPWRAAQRFLARLREADGFETVVRVRTELFGSLAKTGRGHGTGVAVILGLSGEDYATCETAGIEARANAIAGAGRLCLAGEREIAFSPADDLVYHMDERLPFHTNGIRFTAVLAGGGREMSETYYSVGGGFVVQEEYRPSAHRQVALPYHTEKAAEVQAYCDQHGWTIPQLVMENENAWRAEEETRAGLLRLWRVMQECIHRGCHTDGTLPGGLGVKRRAARFNRQMLGDDSSSRTARSIEDWLRLVVKSTTDFTRINRWVSTFALAVNEENACFGRVVTAPTNGAAGVIPAVLMYSWCFLDHASERSVVDFLLTAGEIGSLFKKGATISAAMGGCQAEIGVSSAMAAAGLTHCLGGSVAQCLMAAEIAMEHHLGMTCDPVGGLVQVPCIERNTMGAIKAITAANLAIGCDPGDARVSLDDVIRTMWETAQDMGTKYKETAEGGLALHVSVKVVEC